MIGKTPLEQWLDKTGISIADARAICKKKGCETYFDTLMNHPFTLPKMAFDVSNALGIPPDKAAKLGKPIDADSWRHKSGLEVLDPINSDTKWYERLRVKEEKKVVRGEGTWLDVVAFRKILGDRGINYAEWVADHRDLYNRCRTFAGKTETRVKNIRDLASLLGVDPESILTNIATINDQQNAAHISFQHPVTNGMTANQRMSDWCKINVDRIYSIVEEKKLTYEDIAERMRQFLKKETSTGKIRERFRYGLHEIAGNEYNKWVTAERYAHAIDCKPDEIAHRYTTGEWQDILDRKRFGSDDD